MKMRVAPKPRVAIARAHVIIGAIRCPNTFRSGAESFAYEVRTMIQQGRTRAVLLYSHMQTSRLAYRRGDKASRHSDIPGDCSPTYPTSVFTSLQITK
ncbi:hypothetical protein EVAR_74838_1 [Eumeta japonica]|uniref:Uncharacterized protein n=1 Tax=Eumeta variegata TaxID=151549 RepID=A0A4C1SSR7_EUMVA|nr:hypothetical protein EVAR_74838_1 [Eumeta japonica]